MVRYIFNNWLGVGGGLTLERSEVIQIPAKADCKLQHGAADGGGGKSPSSSRTPLGPAHREELLLQRNRGPGKPLQLHPYPRLPGPGPASLAARQVLLPPRLPSHLPAPRLTVSESISWKTGPKATGYIYGLCEVTDPKPTCIMAMTPDMLAGRYAK